MWRIITILRNTSYDAKKRNVMRNCAKEELSSYTNLMFQWYIQLEVIKVNTLPNTNLEFIWRSFIYIQIVNETQLRLIWIVCWAQTWKTYILKRKIVTDAMVAWWMRPFVALGQMKNCNPLTLLTYYTWQAFKMCPF